ncbi:MAG TPA: hypothetical protein DCX82_15850 [Lachnospiraceae bacterium]|jgi:hypothetical protein|nr:hypothetical protein [Lachnospiraceae bacterium]
MQNVRLAVLDHFEHVLTFFDNSIPDATHYDEAILHTYLQGSAYTLDVKASSQDTDSQYLVEGNKIAFVYKSKDYMCNIINVSKDERDIEISCFGLILEMTNETREPYTAPKAMSFSEYLKEFDPEGTLTLGINEVSNKSMVLSWEGSQTVLARLYSIANSFESELEFVTNLNNNYSLDKITLNVYREHSDQYQGLGERKTGQILRWGKEIETIRKESDITDFFSAIRPRGRDGLDLAGYERTEYDENGNLLYYTAGNLIFAPQARDRFPSNSNRTQDRYASYDWEYDTDSQATLYGQALAQLKKYSVPQVTYEIKGYFDASIGDTFSIEDDGYTPMLILEARVSEQEEYFVDETQNKTTFSNVVELQSEIDPSLLAAMRDMMERNKVFLCSISSDNGTQFHNGAGSTTLTAQVRDGRLDASEKFTYQWFRNGSLIGNDRSITVTAALATPKAVYRFAVFNSSNEQIGEAEATLVNVDDGQDGDVGPEGPEGPAGIDGQTTYLHIAYANSADGKTNFSITDSTDRYYMGQYTDLIQGASQDPTKYKWAKFRGADGQNGVSGDNALTGNLTLSPIVLPANSDGSVSDYSEAVGDFEVYNGTEKVISDIAYGVVSSNNVTVTISSVTGAYSITAMPDTADYGTAILQAIYKDIIIQRSLSVVKTKQGQSGVIVSDTAPTDPEAGQLWQDTSTGGNGVIKKYNGTAWEIWLIQTENLNVQNLSAISSVMGTITNPYHTETESEWGEEAMDGQVSIYGGGIKNEYTRAGDGYKGAWWLYPDRYTTMLKDAQNNMKMYTELSYEGISSFDATKGEIVFIGFDELYRLKKLKPIWKFFNMGYQKNNSSTVIRDGDVVSLQGYWNFSVAAPLNNTSMNERIPEGFRPTQQTVFLRLVSKQNTKVMDIKIRPSGNDEAGVVIVENQVSIPANEDFWMNAAWITADPYPE